MRCPIPGCIFPIAEDALVCWQHSLQIWERVQTKHLESAGSAITTESVAARTARQADERKRRTQGSLEPGWIYFLTLDDKIKVGWTANLEKRLRSYPPHARMVVTYPASRADERDLHRTLRQSLVAGREWYARTPQVLEYMRDVQLTEDKRHAEEAAYREAEWRSIQPPRIANSRPIRPTRSEVIRAQMYGPFDDEEPQAEGA